MVESFSSLNNNYDDEENKEYLTRQLITYLGNKRGLTLPIDNAISEIRSRLGGREIKSADLFSGSGFVSRLLKKHSSLVIANDKEDYARAISECYLMDHDEPLLVEVAKHVERLNIAADNGGNHPGFISELYAPQNDQDIKPGERTFYSSDNARRLDFYSKELLELPDDVRRLLLAPLLSKASIHANTGGHFKSFYKDKNTGIGKFGGAAGDSTKRILGTIELEVPVMSAYTSQHKVFQKDANILAPELADIDVTYIDPPYNQHPYGSNYFMLNLLANYRKPSEISKVSGIPQDWNRSPYNVRKESLSLLDNLFASVPSRFLLVSFNSEGYVSTSDIKGLLEKHGAVDEVIVKYNAFRASRNLSNRDTHVNEHLFLLDKG